MSWRVEPSKVEPDQFLIVGKWGEDNDVVEAWTDSAGNAHLIAAAPDLLEAAGQMLSAWEWAKSDKYFLTAISQGALMRIGDALDLISIAIEKAEGKQA